MGYTLDANLPCIDRSLHIVTQLGSINRVTTRSLFSPKTSWGMYALPALCELHNYSTDLQSSKSRSSMVIHAERLSPQPPSHQCCLFLYNPSNNDNMDIFSTQETKLLKTCFCFPSFGWVLSHWRNNSCPIFSISCLCLHHSLPSRTAPPASHPCDLSNQLTRISRRAFAELLS